MAKEGRKKQTKKSGNPYLDKVKNGKYLKLPNEMIETLYHQYFRPNESKVFWFIVRKTWGWEKYSEFITLKKFRNQLDLPKEIISRTLNSLKKRRIVVQLVNKSYAIQMDIDQWKDRPKNNKNIDQLVNKNQQTKIDNKTETIETKKPAKQKVDQLVNTFDQLVNKNSTKPLPKANPQVPKETLLKEKKDHHQDMDMGKTKPDDDSLLNILKVKTLSTLKKQPFGLGEPKIIRSIKVTKRKNIDTHFSNCIDYILSRVDIKTPGKYFMTMIKEGDEAPASLYLTRRVELFNSFTGNEFRPEKSTKFENMIEKQVLEKAKERIKEIPFIYNFKNQIERAKDPEIKLRYQKREEEERQKAKIKLVHHICSIIKPSRLARFRKKLLKVDPGNNNFKQAVGRGYELHTKRPYGEQRDERVV